MNSIIEAGVLKMQFVALTPESPKNPEIRILVEIQEHNVDKVLVINRVIHKSVLKT